MDTRLCIIQPDVAGDGGGVVLSPFIFKSLAVLVEELLARLVEADRFGRVPSTCSGYALPLQVLCKAGHGRSGEKSAACRVLDGCGKQDILSVRRNVEGISPVEWVVSRWAVPPSAGITNTSKLPYLSLAKVICLPSGDHMGYIRSSLW